MRRYGRLDSICVLRGEKWWMVYEGEQEGDFVNGRPIAAFRFHCDAAEYTFRAQTAQPSPPEKCECKEPQVERFDHPTIHNGERFDHPTYRCVLCGKPAKGE